MNYFNYDFNKMTIGQALRDISQSRLLLPAIQRDFVWNETQIINLFDSLMKGYPFGTLLLWSILKGHTEDNKFYFFIKNYHERDNYQSRPAQTQPEEGFYGVLDGQQRLTALYVGICGTLSVKTPYARWNNDKSFPVRSLYLNLLGEDGKQADAEFEFAFLKEEDEKVKVNNGVFQEWWFRVGAIKDKDQSYVDNYINNVNNEVEKVESDPSLDKKKSLARDILNRLYRIINQEKSLVYCVERSQDLSRVLDIFIRLNSGGTKLSYSDLLMSIAVSEWKKLDAKEEITGLREKINERFQFGFSNDFVLKAGLVLTDEIKSVKFHLNNFKIENTLAIERNWKYIKSALITTAELFRKFGYSKPNLESSYVLLPIAYYIKHRHAEYDFTESSKYEADRKLIWKWVNRSLLKGIWSGQTDSLLVKLREVIRTHGDRGFPYEEIEHLALRPLNKSLNFVEEDVNYLLDLTWGRSRTFALLALITPGVDVDTFNYHVDHVYPRSMFTKENQLKKAGYTNEEIHKMQNDSNTLANLQLLPGPVNEAKRDIPPKTWLMTKYQDSDARASFCVQQLLDHLDDDPGSFRIFFDERRMKLEKRIKEKLEIKLYDQN